MRQYSSVVFGSGLAASGAASAGGAVSGGRYYGTAPHMSVETEDQVGQGRLLPSTAIDQYAATLASWFGVPDSEMATVLPNIGNFATRNLGFV